MLAVSMFECHVILSYDFDKSGLAFNISFKHLVVVVLVVNANSFNLCFYYLVIEQ